MRAAALAIAVTAWGAVGLQSALSTLAPMTGNGGLPGLTLPDNGGGLGLPGGLQLPGGNPLEGGEQKPAGEDEQKPTNDLSTPPSFN